MARRAGMSIAAALRDPRWLTRERVRAYMVIILAVELIGLAIVAGRTYGLFLPIEPPTSLDYMSFQAAGTLADRGQPAAAYDEHVLGQTEKDIYGDRRIPLFGFYYPPVFQLLCAALALLPFTLSYLVFMAATALAYLAVLRGTLRDALIVGALISFPAAFYTLIVGQNAFLTAALFGGALLVLDRRPVLAGILFGAMCYKPHFLLLVPVALIAGRHWKTLAAAAVTGLAIAGLSLLALGWETWHAFLTDTLLTQSVFETGRVRFWYLVSAFGAVRLVGGSAMLALSVQALASLAGAVIVAMVWYRRPEPAIRASVLIAATLVAVPVILFYDLLPATVAIAWLIGDARRRGYLPWEKIVFCAMWPVALLCRGIGEKTHIPTGWLVTFALLALALLHARRAIAPEPSAAIEVGEKA
jgi:hypothetical protein